MQSNHITPNALNTETFEYWMQKEREYAVQEYDWAYRAPVDYRQADRCHNLRWRCMDLAMDSLNKGLVEQPQARA